MRSEERAGIISIVMLFLWGTLIAEPFHIFARYIASTVTDAIRKTGAGDKARSLLAEGPREPGWKIPREEAAAPGKALYPAPFFPAHHHSRWSGTQDAVCATVARVPSVERSRPVTTRTWTIKGLRLARRVRGSGCMSGPGSVGAS